MRTRFTTVHAGRPPDEPAVLGVALNEVFISYSSKAIPGDRRFLSTTWRLFVSNGCGDYEEAMPVTLNEWWWCVWSFLRQFMYTKFVLVWWGMLTLAIWSQVTAAMCKHMDPSRDTLMIENTPIDSLDFASPVVGLEVLRWAWNITRSGMPS